jgi:predicted MFS family arabinose efflux permease
VLALPFITEVWHIFILIGVLQAASAAFTPTFQAVIPDIVTKESDYTRALSASQVAYTMESLLSPVLAALALTFVSFNWLFVGTSLGFAASAFLVLSTTIPNARPSAHANAWDRVASGIKLFGATPRLRGIMALNLAVAAAGAIVVVNTVNYVRDILGGTEVDVAWMLAASGAGTLLVALLLPRVLDRVADRAVMTTGAAVLVVGVAAAVTLSATAVVSSLAAGAVWVLIGGGMALVVTPTGRVLRRSVKPDALPEVFAAQFSLSHLAWLVTYPIAGWVGTNAGFTVTWSLLAALAVAGSIAALVLWPREASAEVPVKAESTTEVEAKLKAAVAAGVVPGVREVEGFADASFGDTLLGQEAQSAAGTLAACQCTCVRPV